MAGRGKTKNGWNVGFALRRALDLILAIFFGLSYTKEDKRTRCLTENRECGASPQQPPLL